MIRRLLVLLFFLFTASIGNCQSNSQLWMDYMLVHPFANVWELDHALTYSTLLESPRWRSLKYCPTISRSFSQNIDGLASITISRVWQNESVLTAELRPMLGARFHLTPNRRILLRTLVRLEQRNFKNTDTEGWSSSFRTRIRLESQIPFNNPTMFNKDKLWYGIADAEWFIVMDEDVDERFANRFRFRSGIGYRINYNIRLEVLYTYQESRNQYENATYTQDNIYRFRLRHFINKSNPSKALGVGN